jgi:uncharacterized protein
MLQGTSILDANVWLALAFSDHIHYERAAAWFNQQADRSCLFCRITQMALLRHLTNSAIMGEFVQTQNEAWATHDSFANDPRVIFVHELADTTRLFRAFTQAETPSHKQWTDAYLAAMAVSHDAQLVTFEKTFHSHGGLRLHILTEPDASN